MKLTAWAFGTSALLAGSADGAAPICPGDAWVRRLSFLDHAGPGALEITAVSQINHQFAHPNCPHGGGAPLVGAKASLPGGLLVSSCSTPILHEFHLHLIVSIDRVCSGLSGCRRTRGEHYYNQVFDKYTWSDQRCVSIGSTSPCPFNGCAAPGWTHNIARCRNPEVTDVCGCCRRDLTPLLIDRSGNGLQVSAAAEGALFELDGPGSAPVWVGWPLTTDDAWLVLDRNANGMIDDGSELFGSATPLAEGGIASDGYEALADLDRNGDQRVDALDPDFGALRLWADADRNGASEPRELLTLEQAGVLGLSLDYWLSLYEDANGNLFQFCAHADEFALPGEAASIERLSCDVYPDIAPTATDQ